MSEQPQFESGFDLLFNFSIEYHQILIFKPLRQYHPDSLNDTSRRRLSKTSCFMLAHAHYAQYRRCAEYENLDACAPY